MLMKTLLASLFLRALLSHGQTAAPPKAAEQSQPLAIKDAVEYNAYITAVQMPISAEKTQALEGFLVQYPNTVVKAQVLKAELFVYQWARNEDEVVRTTVRVLEIEPANLQMLSLLAYTYRECANRKGANAKMCAQNAVKFGRRGLDVVGKVQKLPEGMTEEQFNTLKTQATTIFQDAVRFEESRGMSTNERP